MRFTKSAVLAAIAAFPSSVRARSLLAPASHASGSEGLAPAFSIASVGVASVDRAAVAAEDERRESQGMAPRFAVPTAIDPVSPDTHGDWETIDGVQVWRYRVQSEGCSSLNFGFVPYHMPKGGELWIYDAKRTKTTGPFTSAHNDDDQLWTPIITSCDVVLEVNLPADVRRGELKLALKSVQVGYRGFHTVPAKPAGGARALAAGTLSGSCNVDVVCSAPDGDQYAPIDTWRDEIPAVAVISTGGSTFCTGSLLNNVEQDQTPYFLTANHCEIDPGSAPSLVTYYNYETSTCQGNPNGSLEHYLTGATHLVSNAASDMTLVRLNQAVPAAWIDDGIASFAGWDRSGAVATKAIAIHHPSTDEKRISFENQPTSISGWGGDPGSGTTHVRVDDWDLGTTEPGSSGSPLFDQNHRVIGQLHGGGAACGNNQPDWYGRFSVSWTQGNLEQYLDPEGTGAMTVDTLAVAGPTPPPQPTPPPTPTPPTPPPTPCIGLDVEIKVWTDNYAGETEWKVTRKAKCGFDRDEVERGGPYSDSNTEHSHPLCLPRAKYEFTITDSYGDGICCDYGSGKYEIHRNGQLLHEGGEFGSSETKDFGGCGGGQPPVTPPTQPPVTPPTQPPVTPPTQPPVTPPTQPPVTPPTQPPVTPPTQPPVTPPTQPPVTPPTQPPVTPPTTPPPAPGVPSSITLDLFMLEFNFAPREGCIVGTLGGIQGASPGQCAWACAALANCEGFVAFQDSNGCAIDAGEETGGPCDGGSAGAAVWYYDRSVLPVELAR